MPMQPNPPPAPAKILTSGWTQQELAALEKLVKAYGTDRSKMLRQLVRSATKLQAQVIDKLEKAGN